MKPIIPKNNGGYHLNIAHQNPPATKADASMRWKSFNYKEKVQDDLLEDQYGLCCYSELRADLEGLGYHCEHIQSKSDFPSRTFDYVNLAASALNSDNLNAFKILDEETFGGHAKQSGYDSTLFVSCHDSDCARYFAYLSDGRVVPHEGLNDLDIERAKYTINLLNLNCSYLINHRRRWYDELQQLFDEHLDKNWSLKDLAAIDLLPTNNKLSPFFSITRQFFGRISEQIL